MLKLWDRNLARHHLMNILELSWLRTSFCLKVALFKTVLDYINSKNHTNGHVRDDLLSNC